MNFHETFNLVLNESNVNIDVIEKIESGGNPKAIGKAGERGSIQIFDKKIWDYIVKDMGQSYDWDTHWHIRLVNKSIGDHYINKIIPSYLKSYKIPDTLETRIAVYNWGIKGLKNAYTKYKDNWIKYAPPITVNYINKYKKLAGIKTTPSIPKPKTPVDSSVHLVKKGDTIEAISKKYKVRVADLQKLNPELKNINRINIGDKIKIL